MVLYQKLNFLKLKISSIASKSYVYAIILASLVLAFYFIPFIILFFSFLFLYRKKYKLLPLLVIIGLFLFSYLLYYLIFNLNHQISSAKVIFKVKTEYGYKYIIRSGIYKYVFNSSTNLNIGANIKINYKEYLATKPKTPYGFSPFKYYFSSFIKAKIKIDKLEIISNNNSLIGRYFNLYPDFSKEWLMLFTRGQNFSNNNFIHFLNEIKLLRLIFFSGLHLYVLVSIIKKIFFIISLNKIIQDLIIIILLFILAIFLNSTTIKRYFLYYLLIFLFNISRKEALSFSFIILTILFPNQIYQISYIIGFSFIFISIILNKYLDKIPLFIKNILSYYLYFFLLLPIILRFYNRFNLLMFLLAPFIILVFKYLLIPATFILIIFPPLSLLTEPFFKFINNLFKNIKYINFSFSIPVMNFYFIFLIYLGIYLFLKYKKIFIKVVILLVIINLFILNYFQFYLSIFTKSYFFNVEQGNFSLIYDSKTKKVMAIDLYGNCRDILDKIGVRKIDYLIITHSDEDHYGGYKKIKDYIKIDNIYLSPTDQYKNLTHRPRDVIFDKTYGSNEFNFVFLKGATYQSKNDNSLVIKITVNERKILYTGDISQMVEKDLVVKYNSFLKCDLLMIPHHGSSFASSKNFIQAVSPTYGIISCGEHNRYRHPGDEVVKRYRLNKTRLFITYKDNTLIYYFMANKIIKDNIISYFYN